MRDGVKWWLLATLCWWLVLLPKQYYVIDYVRGGIQQAVYAGINTLLGERPFHEDSSGMYYLLVAAPVLAIPFGFLGQLAHRLRGTSLAGWLPVNPVPLLFSLLRWFLVFELWEYGWIKLTKIQFYLPEPNTVYTPFGQLSKDIAWWSVMGTAPVYVVFMGIVEITAGLLIAFQRTRFLGLLLALGIFINVVLINVAFDISVKLFSLTLLLMTIALLTRYPHLWRTLLQLPVHTRPLPPPPASNRRKWGRALIVALLVTETVAISVTSGNWYDDHAPRLPFHGAYAVEGNAAIRRLYVHRQGYLIVENSSGQQYSLRLVQQPSNWRLIDEATGEKSTLYCYKSTHKFRVDWRGNGFRYRLTMRRLPYRNLPLLRNSFHWTSDQYH